MDNKKEIIKCKDCIYFIYSEDAINGYFWCDNINGMVYPEPDGFCSYGERKETE